MTRALIIATGRAAQGPDPGPCAVLRYGSDREAPTLLTRLCHRLATLNVSDLHVITRPEPAPLLRKDGHDVVECESLAGDLREIARLARAVAGAGELLLVGLVRAGVPVTAGPAGRLVCVRAGDERAARAAREAVEAVDENRVRLRAAVKRDDGFFTTYAVSTYAPHLTRWAAWWGLTPNAVSGISLGAAVLAAVWFSGGTRAGMVAGALLLYVSLVLDCVDGQLARYTRRSSVLGAWLDAVLDRGKEAAVYAGLAVGAGAAAPGSPVHAGNVWVPAVAALGLLVVRHLMGVSYAARRGTAPAPPPAPFPLTARPDGALSGRLPVAPPDQDTPGHDGRARGAATRRGRAALRWARKIAALPMGERFALISLTAVFGNARVTFTALIAWGSAAAALTLAGRVRRSISR